MLMLKMTLVNDEESMESELLLLLIPLELRLMRPECTPIVLLLVLMLKRLLLMLLALLTMRPECTPIELLLELMLTKLLLMLLVLLEIEVLEWLMLVAKLLIDVW